MNRQVPTAGGTISAATRRATMTTTDNGAGRWWDWHLFGLWVLVNAAAFAVVPLVGVIVEQLAATAAKNLAQHHRVLTVLIIAVIGAALQGIVVGRWQWRLLQRRLPGLERRRWVTATVIPAFGVSSDRGSRGRGTGGPRIREPAPAAPPRQEIPPSPTKDPRSAWRPEEQPRKQEPGPEGQSPAEGDPGEQDPGGPRPFR
jgi:hypothetical protein